MFDPRQKAIFEHSGPEHQLKKLIEEARELIEAVDAYSSTKSKEAWPHVLEEMADVINVIDQFAGYTEAWPLIEAIRDRKIERQLKRMAKEEACRKNDGPL